MVAKFRVISPSEDQAWEYELQERWLFRWRRRYASDSLDSVKRKLSDILKQRAGPKVIVEYDKAGEVLAPDTFEIQDGRVTVAS